MAERTVKMLVNLILTRSYQETGDDEDVAIERAEESCEDELAAVETVADLAAILGYDYPLSFDSCEVMEVEKAEPPDHAIEDHIARQRGEG